MYKKTDFSKCVFNPMVKDIFEEYPKLKDAKVIIADNDANALMKFIIMSYDPGSPLIKDFPDMKRRKEEAAHLAEVKDIDGVTSFSKESYVNIANWYLRHYVRSLDWAVIQANLETFWEYQKRLMTPIEKEENSKERDMMAAIQVKSKLAEDLSSISERIQKHMKQFYSDDDLVKADTKLRFTSEHIAGVSQNY